AALGDVVLKSVDARKRTLAERHDLFEDLMLTWTERAELAVTVVQNAHRRGESKLNRAVCNRECVLRVAHAAAENGVDVDLKFSVLGEELELFIQDFEA